ncbi:hypothetical protein CIHG_07968 [Coccidioides immitis H538.4]|uniref:Uncharacterized protein n=1 Tax=Coccidioides immitis H538.4 TaxID=396776 RepID=A0A0J8URD5_COCIT|nr:hypothetical protein CIHG_07968 [Coccidioides immitis H538.4]
MSSSSKQEPQRSKASKSLKSTIKINYKIQIYFFFRLSSIHHNTLQITNTEIYPSHDEVLRFFLRYWRNAKKPQHSESFFAAPLQERSPAEDKSQKRKEDTQRRSFTRILKESEIFMTALSYTAFNIAF